MGKRNYVIVGGVAGGMSAAARLRRLDESASIIVLERGEYVSFANCGLPYYVSGEIAEESSLLLQTPASLAASLNLDVRVGHEVVGLDADAHRVQVSAPGGITELEYDTLILSPGALPAKPPIPGLDHPGVRTLRTVDDARALRQLVESGARHAVVLGAGFIGIEAAEALAARGVHTTVVEFAPHVLPPLEKELAYLVAEEMRRLGMDVRQSVGATAVQDDQGQAVVQLSDGSSLTADVVVLAVGGTPDTAVFASGGLECERGFIVVDEHGRTNLGDVYAVGDATLSVDAITSARRPVQLAGPANRAGRLVADAIDSLTWSDGESTWGSRPASAGPTPPVSDSQTPFGSRRILRRWGTPPPVAAAAEQIPPVAGATDRVPPQGTVSLAARAIPQPLGTAIVRMGSLTAAMTGANRAALDQAGRAYITIHTHPSSHAGYFPGAKQMHLIVHIDPLTGEILGAQGVGEDGVDKRIDVLATAIRGGLTAPDLIDLDLCYSPPFGSAKDPVTMVGLVADNVVSGQTTLWHPEDCEWARSEKVLLLDVRTPQEFATGHLPEAVNIAHTQLRGRLDEVRELAAGRPVAVMCQSGVRSYIAHRILIAAGFDSSTLSGGMLTLRAWLGAQATTILV